MKIYVVLIDAFPHGHASTARVISYCKGFLSQSIGCEVIMPIALERHKDPVVNPDSEGVFEGIPFKYISGSPHRGRFMVCRQLKDKVDYINTLRYLKKHISAEDRVLMYRGGCLWNSLVCSVVHRNGAKIVMELNELPYGTGAETKTTIRLRRKMLNKVFKKFDGFLSISETLSNLVRDHAPKAKNLKVPIIVDTSITDGVKPHKNTKPYIFHSGTLYEQKDGIVGMLEAFAIANSRLDNKYDFITSGDLNSSCDKEKILEVINKYGIEDYVKFTGYLSIQELHEYQKGSEMMIINKYDTQQNRYCFSTKLGEYLAFAKPVIITNIGEAMNYLTDKNAYIVETGHPEIIAEKIVEIANRPQEAKLKGKRGFELAKTVFNNIYQAERIIDFLKTL